MTDVRKTGRVTIPTDLDVVPETLEILKRWGADAIRDCDGTDFPAELQGDGAVPGVLLEDVEAGAQENPRASEKRHEIGTGRSCTGTHDGAPLGYTQRYLGGAPAFGLWLPFHLTTFPLPSRRTLSSHVKPQR